MLRSANRCSIPVSRRRTYAYLKVFIIPCAPSKRRTFIQIIKTMTDLVRLALQVMVHRRGELGMGKPMGRPGADREETPRKLVLSLGSTLE